MLEALLIIPAASREPMESSAPSASPASAPSSGTATRPADAPPTRSDSAPVPSREASAPLPNLRPSQLRIELSAATGVRVGDGQAGVGIGVLSFIDISRWLLGFAGRLDKYRMLSGADSSGALELALLGGRRFWFRSMALDLAAGPGVALGGTTSFSAQSNGSDVSGAATNTVPRLVFEARLAFSALSIVHPFVGLDGDFGPPRSPDAAMLDAPRLPVWTLGLALGAAVGTQ
jgi:hypothetical protein